MEEAPAIVDVNRAPDDRRKDGVVKSHTCWERPVYNRPLTEPLVQRLLARYYHPYHSLLERYASREGVRVGIDCHTMAEFGPPVGPEAGKKRPLVCLGNDDGTCSEEDLESLAECFERTFDGGPVWRNRPFSGGYITRSQPGGIPWIQVEISRTDDIPIQVKAEGLRNVLVEWCGRF